MMKGSAAKILIVDNEPLNIDILEQELEDLGYQTTSAANGQEALAKVAVEAPERLAEYHPTLGAYLVNTILTGTYCSYSPDIRILSPWQF